MGEANRERKETRNPDFYFKPFIEKVVSECISHKYLCNESNAHHMQWGSRSINEGDIVSCEKKKTQPPILASYFEAFVEDLSLMTVCKVNAHHMQWGSTRINEGENFEIVPKHRLSFKREDYGHIDVKFTRSARGNNLLTISGKPFTLNQRKKDASYWECVKLRCRKTKCPARVITKDDKIVNIRGGHNHN